VNDKRSSVMGEIKWGQIIQYRWLTVQRVTFAATFFSEADTIHTIQILDLIHLENTVLGVIQ
jgi:hypothetical protein